MTPVRQALLDTLETLSDEQVEVLLQVARQFHQPTLSYDENNDPAIGFFSGSPDLATKAKEILSDIDPRSGWTQK